MSKQLTIRDVDEQLAERLKHEAQRRGLSVNRAFAFDHHFRQFGFVVVVP